MSVVVEYYLAVAMVRLFMMMCIAADVDVLIDCVAGRWLANNMAGRRSGDDKGKEASDKLAEMAGRELSDEMANMAGSWLLRIRDTNS